MASTIRSWLIRVCVAVVLGGIGFGAYTAATWVDPEQVRAVVLTHLKDKFGDDVEIHLGSAQMRLFGGLSVTDLQLTRHGESEPFAIVPQAVIFHDKQKLNDGVLEIRKIELTNPTVRLTRTRDGGWDLAGTKKPHATDEPLPTVVVTDGTLFISDANDDGIPRLAIRNVSLTAVNDPVQILKVEGSGEGVLADALSADGRIPDEVFRLPLRVTVRVNRPAEHVSVHIETDELLLGADHASLFSRIHPRAAEYAAQFAGRVSVSADVSTHPDPTQPPKYEVLVGIREGRFENPAIPWPLSELTGTIRLADGQVSVDTLTGKIGSATAELTLESQANLLCPTPAGEPQTGEPPEVPGVVPAGPRWPPIRFAHQFVTAAPVDEPCTDPMAAVEQKLDRFELKVFALNLDGEPFARLTPDTKVIRRMFNPNGKVDVAVRFRRSADGWRREVDILPKGLSIEYEHFRYPITDVYGSLKKVNASDGTDEFQVKLTASAGDRRIAMDGRVAGGKHDPLVDLTIAGKDVLIDEKLLSALPDDYGETLAELGATARGDITVKMKQELNVNSWENTFRVKVYDGTIRHPQFPYTLKQLRGDLQVKNVTCDPTRPPHPGAPLSPRPDVDRVELRNFAAVHDGGRLWLSGESKAVPGTTDRKLTLNVQGENCPLDSELAAGLKSLELDSFTTQLGLTGEITFGADIEVWERGKGAAAPELTPAVAVAPPLRLPDTPFDPVKDLKVAFNFRGPSATPSAFPYDLHDLGGVLRYQNGRLEAENVSARHGRSTLKLAAADVRFAAGGVWANVGEVRVDPLVIDSQFLKALPPAARDRLEEVNLRGPIDLVVKHLVISAPVDSTAPRDGPIVQASVRNRSSDEVHIRHADDHSRLAVRLPAVVERHLPPTRPVITTSAGLLPFSLPWHPSANRMTVPRPTATALTPVLYWNATLNLNGAAIDLGVICDDVHGSVASEGRYDATGGGMVGNAWFSRVTVAKQPLNDVKATYRLVPARPDPNTRGRPLPAAVEFRDISGTTFGGTLGGQARIELSTPGRSQLWLNATGVKLDELAKHHKLGSGELKGEAQGTVLLEMTPDPRTGQPVLTGSGQIDVPEGRLYNLPVLLELVKVLKGQTPDGVAFEEAHATFELHGDRIRVSQLDLLGAAVSLGGSGEMDFTGQDVKFEFYTIWSQTLRRWLTTPLGDVTGLLSGGLFKIELTRVNGELTPTAHMLPAVTDPVKAMAERWRERTGRQQRATVRGAWR